MARLSLYVENCAANYLRDLQEGIEKGVKQPQEFKDVQAVIQKMTKMYIERAQLRRIAKQMKLDFDKVIVAPVGKTSLLATAHNNLTALAERVERLETNMTVLIERVDRLERLFADLHKRTSS